MKVFYKILMTFIFIVFLLQFSATNGYSGWFRHYGGSNYDGAFSIQQISDGGYIVAGYITSYTHGGYDFGIYKLYSTGNKVWFKHYGGAQDDWGEAIKQTTDGGYIVAGVTSSYTYGMHDIAIYKLNSSGHKAWFKHYGGTQDDGGYSIQQTSDGGYIVAGYTKSYTYGFEDFAIYKLNSNGDKVWFKHYGGSSNDAAQSIQQTSDGGYIVVGETSSYSYGGCDFAIYKLNSIGDKVWFKHFGGSSDEAAQSVQQTSDGGYIVTGYTNSFTYGGNDFALYKLDSNGNKIWFRHYGGIQEDYGKSIQQTSDGGYIVAGYGYSYTNGNFDFAIYKLNSKGNKVWFKHYGGTGYDAAQSIQQSIDGGYIVAGYTYSYAYGGSDFAIYKLDSNGDK